MSEWWKEQDADGEWNVGTEGASVCICANEAGADKLLAAMQPQPTPTVAKIAAEVAADLEDYVQTYITGAYLGYRTADAQEMIERAFAGFTYTTVAKIAPGVAADKIEAALYEAGGDIAATSALATPIITAALAPLQAELEQERENHAQLQARCYEGFPSVSDGIFDALKETQAELEQAKEELKAYREGGLTEEILRRNDGCIKVGKDCAIVVAKETPA